MQFGGVKEQYDDEMQQQVRNGEETAHTCCQPGCKKESGEGCCYKGK